MKKIVGAALITFVTLSLGSCNKENHTCICVSSFMTSNPDTTITVINDTKNAANRKCAAMGYPGADGGTYCELK